MKVFTKLFFTLVLCVLGVMTVDAQDKVYATFESPTGITWDSEAKTFSWSSPYGNQLHNIGLPNGNLTSYEKLVIDCEILEGDGYRFMFYANSKGTTAGGVTIVTESGKKEYNLSDFSMDAAYLTDCQEICLSGYNGSGKVKVNEVYLVKSSDPLALPKENLSKAIAKAKLCTSIGKTAESFAALQTAITTAQAAYDATDATEESLTSAMKTLNNAVDALALADGYTNLSADMFKQYASLAEPGEGTAVAGAPCVLFTASGLPYGDGNVSELKWADLAGYDKLIVVVAGEVKPRFCMNRLEANGQQAETKADSKMLDINPNNEYTWSTEAYETIDGKTFTIDLKKIVDDYNFARLHCIKAQGYGTSVIVTDMLLYKEAAPAATEVTFDFAANKWEHALGSGSGETAEQGNITEPIVEEGVTLSFDQAGATTPARFWTGPQVRAYSNSVIALAAPEGKAITKVEFTANGSNFGLTANPEGLTEKVWEGNASSIKFVPTKTNQLTKIVVTIAAANEETVAPATIANTAETAYTVAKAIELIEAGKALSDVVFVKGIVSQVDKFDDTKKYITYWISDDGTTKQFECYQGKGIDGADFASIDDVKVGATVVVTGTMTKYQPKEGDPVYEFNAGNKLVTYVAPKEPAEFTYQKYIIANIASEKYWGVGNSWGTQASLVAHPEYVKLDPNEDGTYKMESQVNNGGTSYYFNGDYMDNGSPLALTIKRAGIYGYSDEEETQPVYAYTIANGDNYFGWDGTSTVLGKNLPADSENALWLIVSLDEAKAALRDATMDDPMDATLLIEDHDFGRNNRYVSKWTIEASNKNLSGGEANNGSIGNNCAESYHSEFTLIQVLADAPKGIYALTAQGFYRQDGTDNEHLPYFYANDEKQTFPVKTGTENSMGDAGTSFKNGLYTIDPIFVEVAEGGTLTIGAKLEGNTALWCIWDNFVLTYYGADATIDQVKNGAILAQLAELREKAQDLVGKAEIAAIDAALNAALTETENVSGTEAINAAIATLTAAIDKAEGSIAAKEVLPKMKAFTESTNLYTAEALETYYGQWAAKYEAGTLTKAEASALQDPNAITGWHAANTVDDLLMSVWDAEPMDWTTYHVNTWSTEGGNDGSNFIVPFIEYWIGDGDSLGEKTLTATMNNLEAGDYDVTAWVRVRIKNGAEAPAAGITLQANEGEAVNVADGTQIGDSQFYLKEVAAKGTVAADGVLTIKFIVAADNNISWLSFKNVQFEKKAVEVTHTWDFTKWSSETVANLKAEAAKVEVADMGDGKTNIVSENGAIWSDHEKAAQTDASKYNTTYAASKDNCFWLTDENGGELKANGVAIAELAGLEFIADYTKTRSLAIAVNYPKTSLGEYHGPAYLWFGGSKKDILTIKAVKAGTTIKMGVESHKSTDARGVQLFVGDVELKDAEGNAVAAPKTYVEQEWKVPGETGTVNVLVKNTNGCHIYFIDAEQDQEVLTGINAVKAGTENGAIYNLNGQKVQKAQKGLYIIGGRKVVIK